MYLLLTCFFLFQKISKNSSELYEKEFSNEIESQLIEYIENFRKCIAGSKVRKLSYDYAKELNRKYPPMGLADIDLFLKTILTIFDIIIAVLFNMYEVISHCLNVPRPMYECAP